MKLNYKPKSSLEKFGAKVYQTLVENFPQTFYVGGMVRDILLEHPVTDIDISTQAKPDEVMAVLDKNKIVYDSQYKKFGIIIAKLHNYKIEIATFRKDLPSKSRYPKVAFANSAKIDSQRRDFTVNALYFSHKTGDVLDFYHGIDDVKSGHLRFIGNPVQRIKEDPLRIIRAIRFVITLNLKIEHLTDLALEKYFYLIKTITKNKTQKEFEKIRDPHLQKIAHGILNHKNLLDKYQ